ncbi:MAG: UDP-N-acetylmuramate dehydrogenase [Thermodesulfobacteriota bacterium]
MEPEVKKRLAELAPGRVGFGVPLAPLTTFGLGGRAAVLAEPDTVAELAGFLGYVRERGLAWFLLGGGSNVLFRDGGFAGVVIRLGPSFGRIETRPAGKDEVLVDAGAAAPTPALLALTRREGLTGLEFLAGIPGRVGGALAMNAGTREGQAAGAVAGVEILEASGRTRLLRREELKPGYRRLELPEEAVILKGIFRLRRDAPEMVEARVSAQLERRAASQPRGVRSAGSVFRNPPGDFAGRLIEQAGLKGRRIGGAWVAREHANFIVHQGGATSGQVLALMEEITHAVRERFGIELEPEVIVAGQNGEAD